MNLMTTRPMSIGFILVMGVDEQLFDCQLPGNARNKIRGLSTLAFFSGASQGSVFGCSETSRNRANFKLYLINYIPLSVNTLRKYINTSPHHVMGKISRETGIFSLD